MIGIYELGLLFIGAAWFVQVFDASKKESKISKQFVLLYALGMSMVLLDGLVNFSIVSNILNLIALAGSLIVYFKLK